MEPNILKIGKLDFTFDNFPEEEIRIMHIADIHSFGCHENKKRVVEAASRFDPDFIFLTGDMIDWRTTDFKDCSRFY